MIFSISMPASLRAIVEKKTLGLVKIRRFRLAAKLGRKGTTGMRRGELPGAPEE
jgi:hypothetical protein